MAEFNNRATVTLGGERIELAASNGACVIYADEFRGKMREPFTGNLRKDILQVYRARVEADGYDPDNPDKRLYVKDGMVVRGEDVGEGEALEPVTPRALDYEDVPEIVGIVWAMSRAAGSTSLGWFAFRDRFLEASSAWMEFQNLYDALVIDLAQRAFFRLAPGPEDAGQPD